MKHARTLRDKLIKIGAKVVSHSRYVIFQMAEVAVPRILFREILLGNKIRYSVIRRGELDGYKISLSSVQQSIFCQR